MTAREVKPATKIVSLQGTNSSTRPLLHLSGLRSRVLIAPTSPDWHSPKPAKVVPFYPGANTRQFNPCLAMTHTSTSV